MTKKYILIGLFVLLLPLLLACDEVSSVPSVNEPTLSFIEPSNSPTPSSSPTASIPSPTPTPSEATVPGEVVVISGTKTLPATTLWDLRNISTTSNLEFSDGVISPVNLNSYTVYESLAIEVSTFKELVLSWNVKDLNLSSLEFLVSVGKDDTFSPYLTMGTWSKDYAFSKRNQNNAFASVSIDTLNNKNINNNFIKLKVIMNPNNNLFKLKNISVTTKNNSNNLTVDPSLLFDKTIDVPALQQLSVPSIGSAICSPTSLAMVMNYYGYNENPYDLAYKVQDKTNSIFGNWTINASYAGKDDLYSRVEYIDSLERLISYIENDIPVVMSITTTNKNDLPGTIMSYPAGHLLVLVGFKEVNGTWMAVVNDPAEYTNEAVRRLYPLANLLNVYKNYSYIVSNEPLD